MNDDVLAHSLKEKGKEKKEGKKRKKEDLQIFDKVHKCQSEKNHSAQCRKGEKNLMKVEWISEVASYLWAAKGVFAWV